MSDKKLDEYFKIIQGNLSNTIDTVSSLNGAVNNYKKLNINFT